MKKTFLLIGYNFYPEPTGIGKYNGEMMTWLMEHGYDCTVITSYPYYPFWKVQEPYFKKRFWYSTEVSIDPRTGGKLKTYRCPQYIPHKPTGLRRILLDVSFFMAACIPVIKLLFGKKFDFVLTVAPSFQVGFLGLLFKKIHNAKLLYHIQDLQIEAARDLKMIKSPKAIDLLFKAEKFIFKRCDVISSISKGMAAIIQQKSNKNVLLFPNWTDTRLFYPIQKKENLRKHFGFDADDKIILYSGAIGEKQGLNSLLEAADQLKHIENIKFIICGSGPYKKQLEELKNRMGLKNVTFFPIQPFEKFNRFLNLADVHLVIQRARASDLVMPSKLTTILAVGGLAIITADEGSGLHEFVKENNIGILVEADNSAALKDALLDVAQKDFSHINSNARRFAEKNLSIDMIMSGYEKFIQYGYVYEESTSPRSAHGVSPVSVSKSIIPRSDIRAIQGSRQ